jgi:hypothetical protein
MKLNNKKLSDDPLLMVFLIILFISIVFAVK